MSLKIISGLERDHFEKCVPESWRKMRCLSRAQKNGIQMLY